MQNTHVILADGTPQITVIYIKEIHFGPWKTNAVSIFSWWCWTRLSLEASCADVHGPRRYPYIFPPPVPRLLWRIAGRNAVALSVPGDVIHRRIAQLWCTYPNDDGGTDGTFVKDGGSYTCWYMSMLSAGRVPLRLVGQVDALLLKVALNLSQSTSTRAVI